VNADRPVLRPSRYFFLALSIALAHPAFALDLLGTAKKESPVDIRIVGDNQVLLSRGDMPIAVLYLRETGAAAAPPLTRDAARAALKDATLVKMERGGGQVCVFRRNLDPTSVAIDALMNVSRASDGFRVLLTGEQAPLQESSTAGKPGEKPAENPAKTGVQARAELAIFAYPDSLERLPAFTYVDGAQVPRRVLDEKNFVFRARSFVIETTPPIDSLNPSEQVRDKEKDLRAYFARSGPTLWTARAAHGGVLLTAPLLGAPRDPYALGSFVIYAGLSADSDHAELSPVRLNRRETPARDFLEGAVRVYASGANPFDLSELAVVAEIALPPRADGDVDVRRLPCFYWEAPSSHPAEGEFRFRFAPPVEGVYGVRIAVATATGQVRSDALSFRAGPPASHGFLHANPDARALQFDDGAWFFPVAVDVSVPPGESVDALRQAMRAMNRVEASAFTLNLAQGALRLEGPKTGQFDPDVAARVDEILLAAQARDIFVTLVLEDALAISTESPTHPYFTESGGPLTATPEFFRNPAVKRAFQARLAYAAARFGAYRSVLSWDLLKHVDECWKPLRDKPSEIRLTPEESDLARRARRDVQEWAADLGLALRGMDSHQHPIAISLTLSPEMPWVDLERAANLDWISVAATLPAEIKKKEETPRDEAGWFSRWGEAARDTGRALRPYRIGELTVMLPNPEKTGLTQEETGKGNQRGVRAHALFASLTAGFAGTPEVVLDTRGGMGGMGGMGGPVRAAARCAQALSALLGVARGKDLRTYLQPKDDAAVVQGRYFRRGGVFWFCDRAQMLFRVNAAPEKDARVPAATLPILESGAYRATWFSAQTGQELGRETLRVPGGEYVLRPPQELWQQSSGEILVELLPAD
jgi:hypothetical protein